MEPQPLRPEISRLLQWLEARGARFPGCVAAMLPGMGAGLLARRDLDKGDEILRIPKDVWITRKTRHTDWIDVLDWTLTQPLFAHSMSRLALLLFLERRTPESFFETYLDALDAPTMPHDLGPAEVEALQVSEIAAWCREQDETVDTECARLREALPAAFPDRIDAAWFTPEAWRWAYGHTVQRTFSVDLAGEEVWVLIPGMDLLNHDVASKKGYYTEDDAWCLEARQAWRKGEQITISYGRAKNSADLFLYYGFVAANNPSDRVALELVLDPEIEDGADRIEAIDVLGLEPTCRIARDGVLPPAFRNAAVLWSLSPGEFRAPGLDFADPRYEARALQQVVDGIEAALSGWPTTLAEDLSLQTAGGGGIAPSILAYRIACKDVLAAAARSMREQVAGLRAGSRRPNDPTPDPDQGRYPLTTVRIPIGP